MKKLTLILTIVAVGSFFSSCNNFLNDELQGKYTSGTYYTSEENAIMAVNSIYNSLYGTSLWIFGDVASDDAVKGGNAGDQADINGIDNFSASADNGVLNTYWQATYEIIARANNAIAYIPNITMDETNKNQLIGEAKFLRAYAYFNLVNIFGKVPLKLQPQNTSAAVNVGLSEVYDVYTQIEKDLTDAVLALPVSYSADKGRATKGAALALLAKTDLYQQKYTECLTNIQKVEDLHQYDLEGSYTNLFKAGAENSKESIFGIRYIDNKQVSLGNLLNVWFAPSIEGGYYFNAPTQSYVDAFTEKTTLGADDPRLDASIGREGKPWFNNTTFSSSWSEATGYLVKKYNEDAIAGVAKDHSTIPYHIIRYADVILMKAEALNETNATNNAITEVNRIRNRAGLVSLLSANQTSLRETIRNERRKELGFEFHRFFDLMRWGKETAETALGTDFKWSEPRFYFPIPQTEIDTNQALK
ncbi:MAG: RagB/SusD family nutrient uptake outer membrane protein [Bacteroidetes bacterium]|nr:RagB/SusD family nutrient uptake outer membrane protein [Bacteroidota bacterium]